MEVLFFMDISCSEVIYMGYNNYKSPEAKAYQKRIDDLITKYPDDQDWKFEV